MANKLDTLVNPNPYWLSVLIGFDQFINSLLMGYPDETISSRAYRCNNLRRWAIAEKIINTLFFLDRVGEVRHCQLAYLGELALEHFPRDFRQ